jgi:hypothetical protein
MRNTLLIILFFQSIVCFSQVNNAANARKNIASNSSSNYLDLTLTMGIPMDEFGETTSSLPFGFTFKYNHQPSVKIPILYGLGFTYLSAGSKSVQKNVPINITVGGSTIDQFQIPLEFAIRNQIINGHFNVRFQGNNPTVKPFIDFLGGFNYFWTGTTLYDRSGQNFFDTDDRDRIFQKTQLGRITWSAGAGAGVSAHLSKATYLNLSANYVFGGKLNYFDKNQINEWDISINSGPNQSNGSFNSDNVSNSSAIPKYSRTDMLLVQAGILVWLNAVESKKPKSTNGTRR